MWLIYYYMPHYKVRESDTYIKETKNQGFLHQKSLWSQPNTPDLKLKINLNHNTFFLTH